LTAEWLSDGTIAFTAAGQLYSMREDGSDVRPLGGSVPGSYHDWSPDGTRIAFVSYGPSESVLGSTAADGTDVRIHVRSEDTLSDPEWSPDGRYIAFVRQLPGPFSRIFVVDVGSGVVGRLLPEAATQDSYSDWDITWAEGIR
jgi:hypothetical protein